MTWSFSMHWTIQFLKQQNTSSIRSTPSILLWCVCFNESHKDRIPHQFWRLAEKDHKAIISKLNFKPETNSLIKHGLDFEVRKLPKYREQDVGFLSACLFFKRQVGRVIMAVLFWRRLALAHTMPALCPLPSSLTEMPFSSSPTEPALFAPVPPPFVLWFIFLSRDLTEECSPPLIQKNDKLSGKVSKCLSEVSKALWVTAGRPAMPNIRMTDCPEEQLVFWRFYRYITVHLHGILFCIFCFA